MAAMYRQAAAGRLMVVVIAIGAPPACAGHPDMQWYMDAAYLIHFDWHAGPGLKSDGAKASPQALTRSGSWSLAAPPTSETRLRWT